MGWPPIGRIDILALPPPVTGFYTIDSLLANESETFASLAQLILPAAISLFALAPIARMTRSAMLGALKSDYVRTARASGLSRKSSQLMLSKCRIANIYDIGNEAYQGANVLVEKVFFFGQE